MPADAPRLLLGCQAVNRVPCGRLFVRVAVAVCGGCIGLGADRHRWLFRPSLGQGQGLEGMTCLLGAVAAASSADTPLKASETESLASRFLLLLLIVYPSHHAERGAYHAITAAHNVPPAVLPLVPTKCLVPHRVPARRSQRPGRSSLCVANPHVSHVAHRRLDIPRRR